MLFPGQLLPAFLTQATPAQVGSLAFNFVSAVFLTLLNKYVFAVVNFHWAGSLTVVHYVISYCFLAVLRAAGGFTAESRCEAVPITFSFGCLFSRP
jgi:hypothetical protein